MKTHTGNPVALRVLLCAVVALGAGCAINPAPVDQISRASAAIERAGTFEAAADATAEWKSAHDKLGLARHWMADRDNEPATWLAEQSEVDAQLAEAKSQSLRAEHELVRVAGEIRSARVNMASRTLAVDLDTQR